jgi:hypothetical protein
MGEKIFDWFDMIFTFLFLTACLYFGVALVLSIFIWPLTGQGWKMGFTIALFWPLLPLMRPQDAIPAYIQLTGLDDVFAKIMDDIDEKRNK